MTIRNRLTLISSLTFGVVFALAAFVVYYMFVVTSERIIFSDLQKTGLLSAMFYLEEDELSTREHNRIRTDFEVEMQQTDVKVYDHSGRLRYGNGQFREAVTPAMLQRIREEGRVRFKTEGYYYYGLHYPDNQGDFVVVVAADHSFFTAQRNQLLLAMGTALAIGLLLIFLLSYALSRIAYRPISSVIHQVNQLQAHNLERALTLPRTKDELHELIDTFNGLLLRLSENFVIQRNFINYVSHEFKTPLASITGNLEVFAQRERSPAEYRKVSETVLAEVSQLEHILNNLMILAGLRTNPQGSVMYRLDELLWDVMDRIFERWPEVKPLVDLGVSVADADRLVVKGYRNQLQMAVYNVIDNAVKYACGKPVTIALAESDGALRLTVQDQGPGIPPTELQFVHQPFYRGSNVGDTKGSGIGLSLAVLICKQNDVAFSLTSDARGTQATFIFRQL